MNRTTLIEEHVTGTSPPSRKYVGHYRDGDRPVRVIVQRDSYAFQCRGSVAVWTDERGYQIIVHADPDMIYGRRFLPDEDLDNIAADLLATYRMLTGGAS